MDVQTLVTWILGNLAQVETSEAYGYTFFFVGPDRKMPFATLSSSDNEHDRVSHLDRPGVYRLNLGVTKPTYQKLLGPLPSELGPSGIVQTGHDFTQLDVLLPHPVYSPQSWVSILSPSSKTFATVVEPLLREAHGLAMERHHRRETPPQT